jgi:energy-coupling factor transport system ATP-binding protein
MQKRLDDICKKLGLNHIRQQKLFDLSGGEKQLVAIASVLVGLPKVILLDEPTSQLDPQKANEILQVIVNLKQQLDLTVVIAEHRLERLLPYTDQIIHIPEQGGLQTGTPDEVLPQLMPAPPIIEIGRKLQLSPLPVTTDQIPENYRNVKPAITYHEIIDGKDQRNPVLEIKELSMDLGNKTVLNNIHLKLYPEEILAVIGPNGAGKTTLLRAILGLTDFKGEIIYAEEVFPGTINPQVINCVGYLPQNPNDLLFAESILEELKITLKNHNQHIEDAELHQFLEHFKLADKKYLYPRDLSVGERQRAALAAITVNNPPVIFLDEPTRGLDYTNKAHLINILKSWRNSGKSILVITHDIEFAALLADRVAILENGTIIYRGEPRDAFTKFPVYRTQTACAFPNTLWITPKDIQI